MTICKNPKENCMRYPSAWVMRFADELPARARVLDLACGEGRHTGLFLMKGCRVTAVDIDLSHVEALDGTPGLTLECRDLENEPWPYGEDLFDAIIVTNYLHRPHFPHYFASLAPGGLFIMETFTEVNTRIWGRPRKPDHYLLPGELLRLAPAGVRIAAFEEGLTELDYGVERIVWMKPGPIEKLAVSLGAR